MTRRSFVTVIVLLASVVSVRAQDVLTVGSGSAPSGSAISLPVSIRDVSATALGTDAGVGNRIQGIAFKITYPTELVASVTFARAGVIASGTPLYETTFAGTGFRSFVISFQESSSPIVFSLNAAAPGNQIGTLTVTLQAQAAPGSVALLTLDPPGATLSNQAGSVRETVASGGLGLVNGNITVTGIAAPANLIANAISTSQVNTTWSAATGADHYEVWRTSNGGEYELVESPSGTSFNDTTVVAGTTYLYRVRAVGTAATSGFSNVDAATTIFFTDDPLATGTIVKTIHVTELRNAVNAMRAAVSLPPLAAGMPPFAFTDPTLTPGITVKAVHIQELRSSVK